jgi:hypothetical protein
MLLNDEAGRPRAKRILIAAEIRGGASLADSRGDLAGSCRSATHDPHPENIPFAISYSDNAVRGNIDCPCDRLIDYPLHISRGKLHLTRRWSGDRDCARDQKQSQPAIHSGTFVLPDRRTHFHNNSIEMGLVLAAKLVAP